MIACSNCGSTNLPVCKYEYSPTSENDTVVWTHKCRECGHIVTSETQTRSNAFYNTFGCPLPGCESVFKTQTDDLSRSSVHCIRNKESPARCLSGWVLHLYKTNTYTFNSNLIRYVPPDKIMQPLGCVFLSDEIDNRTRSLSAVGESPAVPRRSLGVVGSLSPFF